jgi:tRNA U34 5-methylaminomethyl-2-thiouridine-forming methyltransferase MnmC
MTRKDQQNDLTTEFGPLVETADGSWTIRHADHAQDFHSSEGARFEAWQLYVVASGLFDELQRGAANGISVLDVGMGLGYNACATIAAWLQCATSPNLIMVSLEIDHRLVEVFAGKDAPWTRGWDQSWSEGPSKLQKISPSQWSAEISHPTSGQRLIWRVVIGDASKIEMMNLKYALAPDGFQFIWQDPFTPQLNPTMWSSEWFRKVLDLANPDAFLMTYSVSRVVKDALEAGGWKHERFRTPGKKRHWLCARPRKP